MEAATKELLNYGVLGVLCIMLLFALTYIYREKGKELKTIKAELDAKDLKHDLEKEKLQKELIECYQAKSNSSIGTNVLMQDTIHATDKMVNTLDAFSTRMEKLEERIENEFRNWKMIR